MSADWPQFLLEEIIDSNLGKMLDQKKNKGTPFPYLGNSNVRWGKFDLADLSLMRFEEKEYDKYGVKNGDLIICEGGEPGRCAIWKEEIPDMKIQKALHRVRCRPIVNNYYLYYWFLLSSEKKSLEAFFTGTTIKHLTGKALAKLQISLPPIEYQLKTVSQLKALDDKIESNQRINQTLEQIAQAIFKNWFVDFEPVKAKIAARETLLASNPNASAEDIAEAEHQAAIEAIAGAGDIIPSEQLNTLANLFPNQLIDSELGEIPEGWNQLPLDKIAHFQNGLALQNFRPEEGDEFLPVLKIAQLKAGFADGKEKARSDIKAECKVDNGDVIFSWSGSLEVDVWCGGKAALNQHLFKVTSQQYPKWLYLQWTKFHLSKFKQIAADKAVTMGHIKRSHLSEANCIVPCGNLVNMNIINALIEQQITLRLESKTLEELRDSLLPKLLSGELSVAEN
jgi:type I restriction enzyme, S subunit